MRTRVAGMELPSHTPASKDCRYLYFSRYPLGYFVDRNGDVAKQKPIADADVRVDQDADLLQGDVQRRGG